MAKKTIGLNPLEEYLSAPKNPPNKVVKVTNPEKKAEIVKQAPVEVKEVPIITPKPEVAAVAPQTFPLNEGVEVDEQGQFAIKGTKVPQEKIERPAKQRITLHISTELVDRVKNAVYWTPGLTVAGFAEEAFTDAIDAFEKERGEPFPQRKHRRLRGGRPVS